MELDLVKVKQWIVDAVKRSASGYTYTPRHEADAAFEIIDELNKAIDTGNFVYVHIRVPCGNDLRISQKEFDEIQDVLDLGKKIQAIKLLRTYTDCGLKDAKYAVETSCNWDWEKYREHNYDPQSLDPMCK